MTEPSPARVVIENIRPIVECGRFSAKRVRGDRVVVTANVFAEGQNVVAARLLYRTPDSPDWTAAPMEFLVNDSWQGEFTVHMLGTYRFAVEGWIDHFKTWQEGLKKKVAAGQDVSIDMLIGAGMIEDAAARTGGNVGAKMAAFAEALRNKNSSEMAVLQALGQDSTVMGLNPDLEPALRSEELEILVERPKARFSSWYEWFPRSASADPSRPGTLRDLEALLPEIARMGFDVLYLPPIHPIGKTNRKGKNNSINPSTEDPGSPWAIGSEEGGHKSIDARLGTLEDFKSLVESCSRQGTEIALDLAFQCSPDHPYVREHPEWFKHRPDGSIQYAENPPKKYEDIVPLNFESENWRALWEELKSIVLFWIEKGVRIFRVDNPHTKPFAFWKWLMAEVRREYPDALFLAEAFTRPNVMAQLAKVGFSQSYTYFTWRNSKREITEYLEELTGAVMKEYFRPNFWPNTPDILPEYLQYGGRPAFIIKLILAATLSSNYGIYGPAFELLENQALPGREEYLDSEKFEVRHWDWDMPGNLKDFIARINAIRRENRALQETTNLRFCEVDNDQLLFYMKSGPADSDSILVVVNLDPAHTQSGWIRIPLSEFGIAPGRPYLGHDLLSDEKYIWYGERNFVKLNPQVAPAHIFRLRTRVRRETDFDYFM
ncbi:MAG: alpha-1,4-glucan--maltose-1-phosphate maltosyltransferase [Syntrophobacteraceae bacterium]|jgi:starch synthase (maltosyl-transferring)